MDSLCGIITIIPHIQAHTVCVLCSQYKYKYKIKVGKNFIDIFMIWVLAGGAAKKSDLWTVRSWSLG